MAAARRRAARCCVEGGGRMIARLRLSADGQQLLVERESSAPQVDRARRRRARACSGRRSALKFAVADDDWSRSRDDDVGQRGRRARRTTAASRGCSRTPTRRSTCIAISPHGDTRARPRRHDDLVACRSPAAPLRELARYDGKLSAVVWSPDGRTIAIGGTLPEILLVDAATGAIARAARPHRRDLHRSQFSATARSLLSASDDAHRARVDGSPTARAIVLRGHDDDVYPRAVLRRRAQRRDRRASTAARGCGRSIRRAPRRYVEGAPIERLRLDGDDALVRTSDRRSRAGISRPGSASRCSRGPTSRTTSAYGVAVARRRARRDPRRRLARWSCAAGTARRSCCAATAA